MVMVGPHNSKLTGDNSKLTGDDYGTKFLHLVNSDDCGDSIFLDFNCKMDKEKRYETTIPCAKFCCKADI